MRKNFRFSNTGNAFLLAFASFYAVNLVLQFIFKLTLPTDIAQIFNTWVMYGINAVVFIGVMVWYSRRKKVDFISATKLDGKINLRQIGLIILISIFSIIAFLPLSNIFLDILSRIGFNYDLSIPSTSASVGITILAVLLLAVCPAFSEEILMRGVVLNAATQKRNFSYAIVITAGMFSLMHGNAIQTVHQFMLGMVLAYLVIVSRSLWAAILLHFINNFISIVCEAPLGTLLTKMGTENISDFGWYIIWILSFLIGSTILFLLLKKFTKITLDKREFGDNEIIDVYPEGKSEMRKTEIKKSFNQIIGLFKYHGIKNAYQKLNVFLNEIDTEEVVVEEPTREDFMPSNIKLAYTLLIVIWIINLITGLAG